jgi:hypothetical protein
VAFDIVPFLTVYIVGNGAYLHFGFKESILVSRHHLNLFERLVSCMGGGCLELNSSKIALKHKLGYDEAYVK